jgi:hypothetical protein
MAITRGTEMASGFSTPIYKPLSRQLIVPPPNDDSQQRAILEYPAPTFEVVARCPTDSYTSKGRKWLMRKGIQSYCVVLGWEDG